MINFNDLKKRTRANRAGFDRAIGRVLKRGWFVLGPELEKFEKYFASFLGVNYAIGVNSGTDAIYLSLLVAGVKPDQEVITVANTAPPTVCAIRQAGARPVFVDIDPSTMNMDPKLVEASITPRTAAILPVHLYGYPASLPALARIAKRHQLPLIEDAAQAHGAIIAGRPAGTWGLLGAFSFYPTKNLGALGDAGAIVTNDRQLAERLRQCRNYGEAGKYRNVREGVNSRLDELQAAILTYSLRRLPGWNRRRAFLANLYRRKLTGLPLDLPPHSSHDLVAAYHLFVIRTKSRDRLAKFLADRGIGTAVHYPRPIYRQPAYRRFAPPHPLIETEKHCRTILTLPLFPELTRREVEYISRQIRQFYGGR